MKINDNILNLIGQTPMVKLNTVADGCHAHIFVKLECFNPMSSVKDRAALAMLEDAEKKELINKETTIIEPSSGNTGIALALVCAVKGYKLIITMPESMSIERRKIIAGFGAEIVLTPAQKGMKGAIEKAQELSDNCSNSFIPMQFSNEANPQMHFSTTAREIWQDTAGQIDVFVAGVGTGGTITGVGRALKEKNHEIKIVAVEPANSPVISGGSHTPHKIQGIGAGFIPDILDKSVIDEVITIHDEEAIATAKKIIRHEGIFCGISSGANVYAALKLAADKRNAGKNIVTVICDTGERYLSTALFE